MGLHGYPWCYGMELWAQWAESLMPSSRLKYLRVDFAKHNTLNVWMADYRRRQIKEVTRNRPS